MSCPPAKRRTRAALLLFLLASVLSGCAQLPGAERLQEWRSAHHAAPAVADARGALPPQRAAALLQAIKQRAGNLDILHKHLLVEEALAGSALVAGNAATLLQDGPQTYQSMFQAIRSARRHINLESYIIEDDEVGRKFAELLREKQAQGVQVNLIYDSVGSMGTPRSFFDALKEVGIRVVEFNPVNPLATRGNWRINNRDHRKLLITDGTTVFLGGINISSVYSSGSRTPGMPSRSNPEGLPWRDTQIRLEGPVVAEFQKLFLQAWTKQGGPPLAEADYLPLPQVKGAELVRAVAGSADDPAASIYLTLLSAIESAERQIHITNAYFVPDEQLVNALVAAAARGVDVRLILPGRSDFWPVLHAGRARYAQLLEGGVRIFERRDALLHAKTAVIDGVWSCIGSANMDWRSFLHNEEVNAVVLGTGFAAQMLQMFAKDLALSREITAAAWAQRPLGSRLREWAARLWEYWL